MSTDIRAGAITRTELDQELREIANLVDEAREAGWDSDPTSEHRALTAARAVLASVDQQLADRVDYLLQSQLGSSQDAAETLGSSRPLPGPPTMRA